MPVMITISVPRFLHRSVTWLKQVRPVFFVVPMVLIALLIHLQVRGRPLVFSETKVEGDRFVFTIPAGYILDESEYAGSIDGAIPLSRHLFKYKEAPPRDAHELKFYPYWHATIALEETEGVLDISSEEACQRLIHDGELRLYRYDVSHNVAVCAFSYVSRRSEANYALVIKYLYGKKGSSRVYVVTADDDAFGDSVALEHAAQQFILKD